MDKYIENIEIFDSEVSYLDVFIDSSDSVKSKKINISPITLWGDYTNTVLDLVIPKVLKETIIPEYIIVHNGIPNDSLASNYKVSFVDYIKNIACSKIYSTWPKETIKANVIAIISFVSNRIYTEWYLSRGYDFTITSSTTYDQHFVMGRPIFKTISDIVDDVFNIYIKRNNSNYPILSQYRSNTDVKGIMSQWGSKELGDKGYSAIDILKYYYGNIELDNAKVIENYPKSFEGNTLKIGACGDAVYTLENQLNFIRGSYPGIPIIESIDGLYSEDTKNSVSVFQSVFKLPVTGEVDFKTWYKISYVFVAVNDLIKSIYY